VEVKIIKVSDLTKCPKVILLASHYRDNGSCRCDERQCEMDFCDDWKFSGEIYCKTHLIEMYGPEEFDEVEG